MKRFLSVLFVLYFVCPGRQAIAQFQTVYIGVNGLTCSQCTRTVELSIRKLGFVKDVQMNLEHTEGAIVLDQSKPVDIEQVAQAVFDAGFSVRYLHVDFLAKDEVALSGSCFNYLDDQYVFTILPKTPLKGTIKLKFIGKKFMPKSEYREMRKYMNVHCGNIAGKVYHVTLL